MLTVYVGVAEVASRSFWAAFYYVPFLEPGRILDAWYPALRSTETIQPSHEDASFDVLILGGSVPSPAWGLIPQTLDVRLNRWQDEPVRIFNFSDAGHTSRDSLLKYEAVGSARFDLVIFYHGINEARANNAPDSIFRENYDHYAWYEIINAMAPFSGRAWFALPYTLRYAGIRLGQIAEPDRYVPMHGPRKEWLEYGATPRSAVSFEKNLEGVIATAEERGDVLVIATFPMYVPADYSEARFRARELDYGAHLLPISRWGLPDNVTRAVDAHNEVVRRLAERHPNVILVDLDREMPRDGVYFDDVCHLTVKGSRTWVKLLMQGVDRLRPGLLGNAKHDGGRAPVLGPAVGRRDAVRRDVQDPEDQGSEEMAGPASRGASPGSGRLSLLSGPAASGPAGTAGVDPAAVSGP
jgi:hypothetical protein